MYMSINLTQKKPFRYFGDLLYVGSALLVELCMNSMKLVNPLLSLYWSIHTKDESKRDSAFAFIFGVN